jgi:hypothetical protein
LSRVKPDVLVGQVLDRGEDGDALVVGVGGEAALVGVLVAGDGVGPGGRFGPPHAEQEDGLAIGVHQAADKAGGGPDLHPVGAPAEGAVGGGIALAQEVHPEALLRKRFGADDAYRDVQPFQAVLQPLQQAVHEVLEDGRLDERVVADDMDGALPLVRGHAANGLQNEMEEEGGVLAAGEADDPRMRVGLEVFVAEFAPDKLQLGMKLVEGVGRVLDNGI